MLNQAEGQPLSQNQRDAYRVTWLEQRIGICEGREQDLLKRITVLEQQIANHAVELHKWTNPITLKSQAAQQQAQGICGNSRGALGESHLYAPLRSDTKPLLEMAAFVRKVANVFFKDTDKFLGAATELEDLAYEAQEILKRST
jgi:hypothetical protein